MKKALAVSLMVLSSLAIADMAKVYAQTPSDAVAATAPAVASAPVDAAAPVAPAANEEDKFSFGKVISVVDGQITVKEYDFTKDADIETVYSVTTETELGNIAAVADLKVGDDIVIDYLEKEGKRVVTTLVKEEKGMEAMPAGEGEAAPAAAPEAAAPAEVPADAAPTAK